MPELTIHPHDTPVQIDGQTWQIDGTIGAHYKLIRRPDSSAGSGQIASHATSIPGAKPGRTEHTFLRITVVNALIAAQAANQKPEAFNPQP
jgi:hypothetical protein